MRPTNTKTRKKLNKYKTNKLLLTGQYLLLVSLCFFFSIFVCFLPLNFAYSMQLLRLCGNCELQRFSNTANYFYFSFRRWKASKLRITTKQDINHLSSLLILMKIYSWIRKPHCLLMFKRGGIVETVFRSGCVSQRNEGYSE